MITSRRQFIKSISGAALFLPLSSLSGCRPFARNLPPVRAITHGPKFHWFGYYDKFEFDPTDRYVLGMEVNFEHRSPKPDDVIKIGMVDLEDNDRWIELDESRAWNWQQGCMLQWLPGSSSKVIWNDRQEDHFVSHILDITIGKKRTLPYPIYTFSPDGKFAISLDFERMHDMSAGYGYAGLVDPNKQNLAPKDAGIYRIDLETGQRELIIDIGTVASIPYPYENLSNMKHYFNVLLFNPDGSRFAFLHRWKRKDMTHVDSFGTRLLTASYEGKDIRVITDYGHTSHFIWRDPEHILAWAQHPSDGSGFYLFEDGSQKVEIVGKGIMTRDGHCTYLPGNEWLLNDTYPDLLWRDQEVYLYHIATGNKVALGKFHSPRKYTGEWRVDTHPRSSRDGKKVVIDSPHGGDGRQLYLIDISKIVT